jgi:PII-like signaling protein/nucleotide-binding universal stress UspA family protein
MFQRILVVIDAAADSRAALDYAIKLARRERAEMRVIGVVPIPEITGTIDEVDEAQRAGREELEPVLREAREMAAAREQPVTTEILFGHGDAVIRHYAAEHGYDLIVLARHYQHLGHVIDKVARHARCPVFVAGETEVVKHTGADDRKRVEWEVRKDTRVKLEGLAKMLRIYVGENDKLAGRPLYEAIVMRLRELDVAGATVYRGILGYGAQQRLHRSGFLHLSHNAPMMIAVVDTAGKIQDVLPELEWMVSEGLIVLSDVEIIKYAHRHNETVPSEGES